jgi:hypothetical protein
MSTVEHPEPVVQLITTRSDAEIVEDLRQRLLEQMQPVLEIFDEAAASGLTIQWDGIAPVSPRYKHQLNGLKFVKYF